MGKVVKGIGKAVGGAVKSVAKIAAPVASVVGAVTGNPLLSAAGQIGGSLFGGGGEAGPAPYSSGSEQVNPANQQAYANLQGAQSFLNESADERRRRVSDVFAKFSPQYYEDTRKGVVDPLLRQSDRRATKEKEAIEVSLARRGLNRSSQAATEYGDQLEEENKRRIQAALQGEQAVQSRLNTTSTQRSNANRFLAAGDTLAGNLLTQTGRTGVDYTPNPGGALGDLASAVSESNALKIYKQNQDNAQFDRYYGGGQPSVARAQVALNKFKRGQPSAGVGIKR